MECGLFSSPGGCSKLRIKLLAAFLALAAPGLALAASGPVEAGRAEVRAAIEARKLASTAFRHSVEQSMALKLESYQIQGALIRGGSPKALLYALVDAAGSISRRGVVASSRGEAELAIRGVRRAVSSSDMDLPREHWQTWFRSLALARFNRARLILPPVSQPLEPFLRMAAEFADQYAIDLTLDLPPVTPAVLQEILRISPVIRALYAIHDNLEPTTAAAQAAGRYVVVETAPGATVQPGIPSRVLATWMAGASRPCAAGCEFVWTLKEGETPQPAMKNSGAAGFEIDQSDLEAWSGFGYKITQSAPARARKAPVRKKAPVKKKAATTRKR
ncbi:MAG: hypothetical protein IH602_02665 [Bryobacteraceae bacterium]|nr:hypothetical protein [Bryobacteraceae bacterium]